MAQCAHRSARGVHRPLTLSSRVLGGSVRYRSPFFLGDTEGDTLGDTQGDTASPGSGRDFGRIMQLIQPVLRSVPHTPQPDFRALFFNSSITPTTHPSTIFIRPNTRGSSFLAA
jgi:hypothetical protein